MALELGGYPGCDGVVGLGQSFYEVGWVGTSLVYTKTQKRPFGTSKKQAQKLVQVDALETLCNTL